GHPREAVKGNLEGRGRRVIPGADGWKLASAMGRRVNGTPLPQIYRQSVIVSSPRALPSTTDRLSTCESDAEEGAETLVPVSDCDFGHSSGLCDILLCDVFAFQGAGYVQSRSG